MFRKQQNSICCFLQRPVFRKTAAVFRSSKPCAFALCERSLANDHQCCRVHLSLQMSSVKSEFYTYVCKGSTAKYDTEIMRRYWHCSNSSNFLQIVSTSSTYLLIHKTQHMEDQCH